MTSRFDQLLEDVIWPASVHPVKESAFVRSAPPLDDSEVHVPSAGCFFSHKLGRLVLFKSERERDFLRSLEDAHAVKRYLERPFALAGASPGQASAYHPDLIIVLKDNRAVVVNVVEKAAMADCENWKLWHNLRLYCRDKGFGLLITDGVDSFQQLSRLAVGSDARGMLVSMAGQGNATKEALENWRALFDVSDEQFFAAVIQERLAWQPSPFKLGTSGAPRKKSAKLNPIKPRTSPDRPERRPTSRYRDRNRKVGYRAQHYDFMDDADATDAYPWESVSEQWPEMTVSDDPDGDDWEELDIDDYPEPTDSIDERVVEDLIFSDE